MTQRIDEHGDFVDDEVYPWERCVDPVNVTGARHTSDPATAAELAALYREIRRIGGPQRAADLSGLSASNLTDLWLGAWIPAGKTARRYLARLRSVSLGGGDTAA
jgi:hypothetical protein